MWCVDPPNDDFQFGEWTIDPREVFYIGKEVLAFVNHKPLAPGHVLIIPKRRVDALSDLSPSELVELTNVARTVGEAVKKIYNQPAWQMSIQDGASAGQTVPHCHIHVIPQNAETFNSVQNDRKARQLDEMDREARSIARNSSKLFAQAMKG